MTWAFDALTDGGPALILRTGPPDDVHAGMELEARAQALAAEAGAPRTAGLVADDSPGTWQSIPVRRGRRRDHRPQDPPQARRTRAPAALQQCAHALAAIHRANPYGVGLSQTDQLAEWRGRLDEMGDTTATFEWAFRWLAANRPASSPRRLVHGDFRMGNLIVDGWTSRRCWTGSWCTSARRTRTWPGSASGPGASVRPSTWAPAGWAASRASFPPMNWPAHDRRPGGVSVVADPGHPALGRHLPVPGRTHLSGQTPSVELAAIGRRVCETEWDLLELLDADGPR